MLLIIEKCIASQKNTAIARAWKHLNNIFIYFKNDFF